MTAVAASRTVSVLAVLIVISAFFVDPITQTLLIAHLAMLGVISGWILVGSPKSLVFVLSAALAVIVYLLAITELIVPGERIFNESIKYVLLILFIAAIADSAIFARRSLLYLSLITPVVLVLYIMLSPDPFVYGGRLGIFVSSTDDNAMISANTIGFAVNICIATILAQRPRIFVYFLPVFILLLYLTFSRGALLSLGMIGIAYFIRERRLIYVLMLGFISVVLFVDINTDLITTTLRLDDSTGSGRTILYRMMFEEMMANPITFLLGHGPGNVNFEIYSGKVIVSAHNGYLEMLYTFGSIGVAGVIYFLSCTIRNYWTLPMDSLLYAVLLGSYALSEDLMGSHNLLPIGLMLGLLIYDFRLSGNRRTSSANANPMLRVSRAGR
jgi:O-antigen ligase